MLTKIRDDGRLGVTVSRETIRCGVRDSARLVNRAAGGCDRCDQWLLDRLFFIINA